MTDPGGIAMQVQGMPPGVSDLLGLGLQGIVIVWLGYLVRALYLDNGRLKKEADATIAALQEKRIDTLERTVTQIGKNEAAMEKMSEAIDRLTERVSRNGN